MAKKIQVYFRDEFGSREFSRLAEHVVRALRSEFPDFIVCFDIAENLRERLVVYAYGLRGDVDDNQVFVLALHKIVERLLSEAGWRNPSQPMESLVGATEGEPQDGSIKE